METLEELTPGELSRLEKGQALSRSVFFNSDRNYGTLKRYGETGYKVTFIFNYVEADHTRTHTAKGQAENLPPVILGNCLLLSRLTPQNMTVTTSHNIKKNLHIICVIGVCDKAIISVICLSLKDTRTVLGICTDS